ncbi:hypothetical protein C5167_041356 [Papaver somniferum]|nr:hypothetical protein C5167_041356 [Papaver somniferum]
MTSSYLTFFSHIRIIFYQNLTKALEAQSETQGKASHSLSFPFITAITDGPKHIETTLTRAKFEELCSDLLDRLKVPVQNSLKDAKLSFKDLDEVILVGGSTRIPAVQELVKSLTGKDPNVTVNPDEVVALGAAVQAFKLTVADPDTILDSLTREVKEVGPDGQEVAGPKIVPTYEAYGLFPLKVH